LAIEQLGEFVSNARCATGHDEHLEVGQRRFPLQGLGSTPTLPSRLPTFFSVKHGAGGNAWLKEEGMVPLSSLSLRGKIASEAHRSTRKLQ